MKKLLLLAFAAFAFVACSDDEYNYFELPIPSILKMRALVTTAISGVNRRL